MIKNVKVNTVIDEAFMSDMVPGDTAVITSGTYEGILVYAFGPTHDITVIPLGGHRYDVLWSVSAGDGKKIPVKFVDIEIFATSFIEKPRPYPPPPPPPAKGGSGESGL